MNRLIYSLIAAVGFGALPINTVEAAVATSSSVPVAAAHTVVHRQLVRGRPHRHHRRHHHWHHHHRRFPIIVQPSPEVLIYKR